MLGRRIERQEALQELSEVLLPVYLLLHYHLQYGVLKVEVRVVGLLHHRHAVADSPAAADEMGRRHGVAEGEGGGGIVVISGGEDGPVPRAGVGVVAVEAVGVVVNGGFGFGFGREEEAGELCPPATAAKVHYGGVGEELSP